MSIPPFRLNSVGPVHPVVDAITHRRDLRELEERERDRVRTLRYEELRSEFNSIAVRVRAWEKLHGLRLPTSSSHPVLRAISAASGIPVAALRDEQRARRKARADRPETNVEVTGAPSELSPDSSATQQA